MPDANATPTLVWLRNDLRLADNPAIDAAERVGRGVICLYVLEDSAGRSLGGAAKWWLHHSLAELQSRIESRGGSLILRRGDPQEHIQSIATHIRASNVFWNRRYGIEEQQVDASVKKRLLSKGITSKSFNGCLLNEPWTVTTLSGENYKVFTPYWKAVHKTYKAPPSLSPPPLMGRADVASDKLEDWGLTPDQLDWAHEFAEIWEPGEIGAQQRLEAFLQVAINTYSADRDRPDLEHATSRLSPYLRFGEIAPSTIWRAVSAGVESDRNDDNCGLNFLKELAWREFSYVQFFHHPELASKNYNRGFDAMPWRDDAKSASAWKRGMTGYPLVDAGMRQLWRTGWMHNRVRMIVASFLTKHLLIHWKHGETWFWDTLVDADPASNSASWQWVAGSGADAAPYFRIFNPVTQGRKFDPAGAYVRKWAPELSELPNKYIHAPWEAPKEVLAAANVELGKTYPVPIVDHKAARKRALDAYAMIKKQRDAA